MDEMAIKKLAARIRRTEPETWPYRESIAEAKHRAAGYPARSLKECQDQMVFTNFITALSNLPPEQLAKVQEALNILKQGS